MNLEALSKMLARKPLVISLREMLGDSREPKNLWLFRLLGFDQSKINNLPFLVGIEPGRALFSGSADSLPFAVDLNYRRLEALASWAKTELTDDLDNRGRTVGVVICDVARYNFLLQVKDGGYKKRSARGRFCPFAGAPKFRESDETALARELYEELADPEVVDQILERFERRPEVWATGIQWGDNTFPCFWGISTARDNQEFAHWVNRLVIDGYVAEGAAALLSRPALQHQIRLENRDPGSTFVNGLQVLFENVL